MKGDYHMKRRDFIKTCGVGLAACCCSPLNAYATQNQTYSARKLLQDYDQKEATRRVLYTSLFGAAVIDTVLAQMRNSFEAIIPDIPYIGQINFHLQWHIPNAEKLAEWLVAKEYGVSMLEFSQLHLDQALADLLSMPDPAKIGSFQFGPMTEMVMQLAAAESQLRIYPEAHIFTFVKGDGVDFDWGLDYSQCPNVILYNKYGAGDLVYPLICTQDDVAGFAMRTGYHRTTEIARGDAICDLRWKVGVASTIPDIWA
jgi:hypothetical protein